MPTSERSVMRRRVRCPKCTAVLTEPETTSEENRIYECSICSTLLVAGNRAGVRRSRENRTRKDAEGNQQIHKGDSMMDKIRLIHESSTEQDMESKENEEATTYIGGTSHSGLSYEDSAVSKLPPEDPMSSSVENESLSGMASSQQKTASMDDSVLKRCGMSTETPICNPHHISSSRGSSPTGELTVEGEAGRQGPFSELSYASCMGPDSLYQHPPKAISSELGVSSFNGAGADRDWHPEEVVKSQIPEREVSEAQFPQMERERLNGVSKDSSVGNIMRPLIGKNHTTKAENTRGKFRLFDLSVFGIYNEEAYLELSRGKDASHPKLLEKDINGGGVDCVESCHGGSEVGSDEHADELTSNMYEQDHSGNDVPKEMGSDQRCSSQHECTDNRGSQMDGCGASSPGYARSPITDIDDLVTISYEVGKHGASRLRDAGLPTTEVDDDQANTGCGVNKGDATSAGDGGPPTRDIGDQPKAHNEVNNHGASSSGATGFPTMDSNASASTHAGAEEGGMEMGGESRQGDAGVLTFGFDNPLSDGYEAETCGTRGLEDARVATGLAGAGHCEIGAEKNLIEFTLSDWQSQPMEESPYGALEEDHGSKGGKSLDTEDSADSSWDDDEGSTMSGALKEVLERREAVLMERVSFSTAKSEEQSPLPLRTSTMDKLLQRNVQEIALQKQMSQKHIKAHYEVPYVQNSSRPEGEGSTKETAGELNTEEVKDATENIQDSHPSSPLMRDDKTVHLSAVDQKDVAPSYLQSIARKDLNSKEVESMKGVQKDDNMGPVDMSALQKEAGPSSRHLARYNVGNVSGRRSSLRLKEPLTSSTEDERAYSMAVDPGGGREKDHHLKQVAGLTEGSHLPSKEIEIRLGQLPSKYYQAGTSFSPRPWTTNNRFDEHHQGGVERMDSLRTAKSRPWNEGFTNTSGHEDVPYRHLDTHMSPQMPAYQGHIRSSSEKALGYSYSAKINFNADRSSISHEDLSHSYHSERYFSNPYGLPGAGNVSLSPQFPPNSVVPPSLLLEPGFTHSRHCCISPACPMCIQQQCDVQQQQTLHQTMMYPCAACASQCAGATYQSLHHSYHMHPKTYSNPVLGLNGSRTQSGMENRPTIHHHNHTIASPRKLKLYPPLPGKGTAPYVLCKDCNQILRLPSDLPLRVGAPLLRLLCGSCGKVSKFSLCLQGSDDGPVTFRPPVPTSAMSAEHVQEFSGVDKRHTNTSSVRSSGWIASSHHGNGLSASAQNMHWVALRDSGQNSQHEWVEGWTIPPPSVAAHAPSERDNASPRYGSRRLPGVIPTQGQGQRRSDAEVRDRIQGNSAFYGEDYPSSPSSASESSPVRYNQMIGHYQQRQPHTKGISSFEGRKLSLDLPLRATVHEQSRPPLEAPNFLDDFYQKGASEGRGRFSSTSLQASLRDPYDENPSNIEDMEMIQRASNAGNWYNEPSNNAHYATSSTRSRIEQLQRNPGVIAGSPLIEHDVQGFGPSVNNRHSLQASVNGSRFTAWSLAQGSPRADPFTYDAISADFDERSHERVRPPMPVQDGNKGQRILGGLLKRNSGKGGQGRVSGRRVWVNGHLIPESAVRRAEELAGPIHTGSYWYDYQAGFWGVMGGPCLGILMPRIEEFNIPLPRDCAGGTTGIIVNGRELHEKDLEVLDKRGLPTSPGKAYVLDISGVLIDDITGQPLKSLGKLAPSIEKKGRGFGMTPIAAPP